MNEADVELGALGGFQDFGNGLRHRPELDDAGERPDLTHFLLQSRRQAALQRLDPLLSDPECKQMLRLPAHPPCPALIQNNRWFHTLLTEGIPAERRGSCCGSQESEKKKGECCKGAG
jgi:type I restriction enzyme, R subunit